MSKQQQQKQSVSWSNSAAKEQEPHRITYMKRAMMAALINPEIGTVTNHAMKMFLNRCQSTDFLERNHPTATTEPTCVVHRFKNIHIHISSECVLKAGPIVFLHASIWVSSPCSGLCWQEARCWMLRQRWLLKLVQCWIHYIVGKLFRKHWP